MSSRRPRKRGQGTAALYRLAPRPQSDRSAGSTTRATPNIAAIGRDGRVAYMGAIDDSPSTLWPTSRSPRITSSPLHEAAAGNRAYAVTKRGDISGQGSRAHSVGPDAPGERCASLAQLTARVIAIGCYLHLLLRLPRAKIADATASGSNHAFGTRGRLTTQKRSLVPLHRAGGCCPKMTLPEGD